MSIEALITSLEAQGRLRRFVPRSRHPPRRRMYLGPPAMVDYDDPHSATNILVGKGFIEAALLRWTAGNRVYKGFLKRLDPPPPEIWELRVTEPVAQGRLFGRFACADAFILTNLHTRQMLGAKGSSTWERAMAACEACWKDLFGDAEPFSGPSIHAYVTENCDDFKI